MTTTYVITLLAGPAIYLVGNALYKKIVYGAVPRSHVAGLAALAILFPFAYATDLLMIGALTTVIMLVVGFWESRVQSAQPRPHTAHSSTIAP